MAALALAGAACAGPSGGPEPISPIEVGASGAATSEATVEATTAPGASPSKVDPRESGFEVGFGEFAVTLEAAAIRPGPVEFVVRNGGKLVHGFEIEAEGDGDNSGHGSGGDDGLKFETGRIRPGETIRFELDLPSGLYKVECFVKNHDDLGMEAMLNVRKGAPKVAQQVTAPDSVSITGFAFAPAELQVAPGTEVSWKNGDPEAHTVTADGGAFDSGILDPGGTFKVAVDGSVTYFCAIHPSMKGKITVG